LSARVGRRETPIQEAIRSHFGEPVYVPTDEERRMLDRALAEVQDDPGGGRPWEEIRDELRSPR